jgi:hypothetical protein
VRQEKKRKKKTIPLLQLAMEEKLINIYGLKL